MNENVSLLSQHYWMSFPKDVRNKLVKLFEIPRTGETLVTYSPTGPIVRTDGYTYADLCSVSVMKMQALLGSSDIDFYKLLREIVNNLDAVLDGTYAKPVPKILEVPDEHLTVSNEIPIKHRGRPKKEREKSIQEKE